MGPLAISSLTSPQATRCPPRALDLAAFDGRRETKVACGAASSPPARPLLPVGQWVARKSVGEGIGWAHSPIPASRALRRRGALRGPWILPPSTADVRPRKLAARRARHRPVRCSQWVSGWLGSPWGRALGGPTRHFKPHEPSGDAVPSAGRGSILAAFDGQWRPQGSLRRGELATGPSTAPLVPQPHFWCAHCLLKAVGAVGRRSHSVRSRHNGRRPRWCSL